MIRELQKENGALKANLKISGMVLIRLRPFAAHTTQCAMRLREKRECDCGLTQLLTDPIQYAIDHDDLD